MATANRDRIGKALDQLGTGLAPFVEREMQLVHGDKWQDAAAPPPPRGAIGKKANKLNWADPQLLLGVMWNHWNDVFARTLGHAERSLVSELRDVRNIFTQSRSPAIGTAGCGTSRSPCGRRDRPTTRIGEFRRSCGWPQKRTKRHEYKSTS